MLDAKQLYKLLKIFSNTFNLSCMGNTFKTSLDNFLRKKRFQSLGFLVLFGVP
jgi:hypothetical protein